VVKIDKLLILNDAQYARNAEYEIFWYVLARIMHEEWNADRIVDGAMHDCDECQNLPRVYD